MVQKNEERELKRINEKLNAILQEQKKSPKPTLVKVGFIKEVYGLDKEGMRKARKNNLLKQVKRPDGIWYELETIHPMLQKC